MFNHYQHEVNLKTQVLCSAQAWRPRSRRLRAIGHVGRGRGLDYLALAEEVASSCCDGHLSDEGLGSFEELSEADHGGPWIDWGITVAVPFRRDLQAHTDRL